MGSHNVRTHCLQTIWDPITCALTECTMSVY